MPIEFDFAFLLPFALLETGAFAGTLAGLLGVGGGIVIVPILYMLLPAFGVPEELRMHLAVGTSLATIVPTGLVSAQSHWKRGGVDVDLLKKLGIFVVLGVAVGIVIGTRAGGETLKIIFASVALLVAVHMGLGKQEWCLSKSLPSWPGRAGLCQSAGFCGYRTVNDCFRTFGGKAGPYHLSASVAQGLCCVSVDHGMSHGLGGFWILMCGYPVDSQAMLIRPDPALRGCCWV